MPLLIACRSSPALGSCISTNTSVRLATSVSLWPTPTVSTITTSNPAASTNRIASRVCAATPPSAPLDGDGRMNACGCRASSSIRVLSPRTEPPLTELDGSTASTATRCPACDEVQPERLDQRRLAHARRAGDAHAQRVAGGGQQRGHRRARQRLVVGARGFRQRDRLGERAAVARADAGDQARALRDVRRHLADRVMGRRAQVLTAAVCAARIFASTSAAHAGIAVPGP